MDRNVDRNLREVEWNKRNLNVHIEDEDDASLRSRHACDGKVKCICQLEKMKYNKINQVYY
jgi:hypothetical protein